ncbi:hypothetical protein [Bdellovibrio sp. HCB2-146]|uniref:hypothetical protein n=1 Tax=Bdellovibrio sp. HCB2-146 TaxID=3394362 RepID=UPI0039BCE56F
MGTKSFKIWTLSAALAVGLLAAVTGYFLSTSPTINPQIIKASGTLLPKETMDMFYSQETSETLQNTLAKVRQQMGESERDLQTEKSLQDAVQNLSDRDLKSLQNQLLNTEGRMEDRQAALYLLTQSDSPQALVTLSALAASELPSFENLQDPHSVGSAQRTFEMSIRVSAIEGLDIRAEKHPEIASDLRRVLQKQKEPTLRFLAETSLSGIEAGRPGHLKRIIDEMLGATQ